MSTEDSAFSGSIPEIYDRYLADLLFLPYAEDMARRVAECRPSSILETAAGTGLATTAIVHEVPDARLVATDLNQTMLDVAAQRVKSANVEFRVVDAQSLPFPDASFDVVACQFGMMFLPDRASGYREARRVLKPGGPFIFNVWDRLGESPIAEVVFDAMCRLFPDNPPSFFTRTPWGYFDTDQLRADVTAAGFRSVAVDTVRMRSHAASPRDAAIGLCQGTPLRAEIEARGDLTMATEVAEEALVQRYGSGPLEGTMSAHVVAAEG
jgi:SAM-dependent methyltransferase